eukprot:6176598-Pleurochrysis_carterae.AAC.5
MTSFPSGVDTFTNAPVTAGRSMTPVHACGPPLLAFWPHSPGWLHPPRCARAQSATPPTSPFVVRSSPVALPCIPPAGIRLGA